MPNYTNKYARFKQNHSMYFAQWFNNINQPSEFYQPITHHHHQPSETTAIIKTPIVSKLSTEKTVAAATINTPPNIIMIPRQVRRKIICKANKKMKKAVLKVINNNNVEIKAVLTFQTNNDADINKSKKYLAGQKRLLRHLMVIEFSLEYNLSVMMPYKLIVELCTCT